MKTLFHICIFYSTLFLLNLALPLHATTLDEMRILSDEYPPFNYRNDEGKLTGVAIELLDRAYQIADAHLDRNKITIQPWPRSYKQVQKEQKIILLSMTRTAERESLFQWVGPIAKTRIGLIAKKNRHIKIINKEDILQYVIGGNPTNIGVQLVRKLLADKAKIQITPHPESLAKMLALNRFDLWAYEENSAALVFKSFGLNPNDYESVYTLSEAELYYALNLNEDPKIVTTLQQAIDKVRGNSNEFAMD